MIYGLQYSSIKKLHFAQQQCLLTALRLVTVCIGLILGAVFLKNTLACLFCFDRSLILMLVKHEIMFIVNKA